VNITVTEKDNGAGILAHRPDCVMVMRHRIEGRPLLTMFECKGLPTDLEQHECLKDKTR